MPLLLEHISTSFDDLFGKERGTTSHPHAIANELTAMQVRFLGAAQRGDLQHNEQGYFVRSMFKIGVDSFDDDSIGHNLVAKMLITLPVSTPKFYRTDCKITENGRLTLAQARSEWAPQGWSDGVIAPDPGRRLPKSPTPKELNYYAEYQLNSYDPNIIGEPDRKDLSAEHYFSGVQGHAFAVLVHNLKNWTIMGGDWSDATPGHVFAQTPSRDDFIARGWDAHEYADARPMTLQEIDFLVSSGALEPMELKAAGEYAKYLSF